MKKYALIPYTFTLMNWATVAGLYHFLCKPDEGKNLWLKYQAPRERKQQLRGSRGLPEGQPAVVQTLTRPLS